MGKAKTPTTIFTVPLVCNSKDRKVLKSRFNAGLRLYNACLNEAEVRRKLIQQSELYQYAKSLPKTVKGANGKPKKNKERSDAFAEAARQYRYSEYDLGGFATSVKNNSGWMDQHLGAHETQKLGKRAFESSIRIIFGDAKKVRFKVANRFRCLEGKSNATGIRWISTFKKQQWDHEKLVWNGLILDPILDYTDPFVQYNLSLPVKYCRVIWRELNGKRQYFAQLALEGFPYEKPKNYTRDVEVGIDLNVSNVAFVSEDSAGLIPFAENVPTYEREIKTLQRKMQRSQRANNPDCFEPDFEAQVGRKTVTKQGKFIKGKRITVRSNGYQKLAAQKRELERRKAEYSKTQNRRLVNEILRHGCHIKAEKVSVKGWQKRWGKAIAAKSPGFFQSELKRKAESAGGSFTLFSTYNTACSQTHLDGVRRKKSLSQRIHRDVTGPVIHRDLMSAFLALCVEDNKLPSAERIQEKFRGLDKALQQAWRHSSEWSKQSAKLKPSVDARKGSNLPQSGSVQNPETTSQIGDWKRSGRKAC